MDRRLKQERSIELKPNSINEKERTVEVVFATEKPVFRGGYWEKMLVTSQATDLTRLKSGHAPILNNHRSESLEDQIGVIIGARIEKNQGLATLKFSQRKSVNDIWEDVKNGILKGISVGYSIDEYTEEEGEDYPTLIGKKWTPHEISIVCVPADENCFIRNEVLCVDEKNGISKITINKKKNEASDSPSLSKTTPSHTITPKTKTPCKNETNTSQAIEAERSRITSITKLCDLHNISKDIKLNLISEGANLEQTKDKILEQIDLRQNENHISQIKIEKSEEENLKEQIQASLEHRMGAPLTEKGRRFKDASLTKIARLLTKDKISSDNQVLTRAMHSSSDFPLLLEAAINKNLISNYEDLQQRQNFWDLCKVSEAKDFKDFHRYRLSEMPGLEEQKESEAVKYGSLSETKTSGNIKSFAKAIGFSRKMLINDDLSAFSNISSAWAGSIIRLENQLFWDNFNNNPSVRYGNGTEYKLFSKEHGNIGTSSPLSIEAISKARIQMMRQKSLGSQFELNIIPNILIVSPELELEAYKIVSREVNPTNLNEVNPYKGAFKVLVSPFLKDTKAWYLACSKDTFAPAFEAVYLSGQRIFTDHRTDWATDSLEYKIRTDLAILPSEPKALLQNKGAK